MKLKIEPLWAGLATFVACLYTWWSMEHLYAGAERDGGVAVMVFYFLSLLIFPVILAITALPAMVALSLSRNIQFRVIVIRHVLPSARYLGAHSLAGLCCVFWLHLH